MSKFIRTVGNCAVNGVGFSLYVNEDGSAIVKPNKYGKTFPIKCWRNFKNLEEAESAIDRDAGADSRGFDRVHALIKAGWDLSAEERNEQLALEDMRFFEEGLY